MSEQTIRAAFESRLASWAAGQVPPLQIAFENASFEPPAGEDYLRAYLLASETTSRDMAGKHREWRGIFQVTAVTQPNTGPARTGQILAALDALFPVNLAMVRDGIRVRVQGPASGLTPDSNATTYERPISIPYQAQTYLP